MKRGNEPILIGRIVGAFGLRGQVKVEPFTNVAERFEKGRSLLLDGNAVEILDSRIHKGRYLLRLHGVSKIDQAESLQWKELYASADDPVPLEEDEFMVDDLIGLRVVTNEGRELGSIEEVLPYPAHDVLVVGKILIPAVREFVDSIDFDTETVTVRLLEGMEEPASPGS